MWSEDWRHAWCFKNWSGDIEVANLAPHYKSHMHITWQYILYEKINRIWIIKVEGHPPGVATTYPGRRPRYHQWSMARPMVTAFGIGSVNGTWKASTRGVMDEFIKDAIIWSMDDTWKTSTRASCVMRRNRFTPQTHSNNAPANVAAPRIKKDFKTPKARIITHRPPFRLWQGLRSPKTPGIETLSLRECDKV